MSGLGLSFYGFFGVGEESAAAYGTPVASSAWLPIISESLQMTEGFHLTNAINSTSFRKVSVPGRRIVTGGVNMEVDGTNIGLPFKWANRNQTDVAFGTYAPAPSSFTATPTSGGSLTAGAYRYRVMHAYNLTAASTRFQFLGAASSEQTGTTASSNLTNALAWTNATPPTGYTLAGTAIFRTAIGGSSGTEKFLDSVNTSTNSYNDDGSVTLSTMPIPTATPTQHQSTGSSSPTAACKSFTTEIFRDATSSVQYSGCKVSQLSLTIPNNGVVTATMNLHAQNGIKLASPSSQSFTLTKQMMGFNTVTYLQQKATIDTVVVNLEHFACSLNNNLDPRYSLNGSRFCRRLSERRRVINGNFTYAFEDFSIFDQLNADTDFSIRVLTIGPPVDYTSTTPFSQTINGVTTTMWPFMMEVDLPAISMTTEKANLNTDNQIMGDCPFEAWFPDAGSKSYDCQFSVWNLASSYPDVS